MSHIFVSYSRHDSEIVDHIVGKIEDAGISVWIDREDIKAGKTWRVQIVQAIDTCDAFVLMLSANSAASDNVRKEIDLAQDSGRSIFIMRLDSAELPAEVRYQLVGLQHIDLQNLGVDRGIHQLIDTLKEHLVTLKPADKQTVRQAELVFQGVDLAEFGTKKQEQTLNLISALTATPPSQLDIANLTAGIHVFVDMPAMAAFELKTRALNRDRRLKQFGIKSLRLEGDKKYVNVSLGILTATATIGILQLLWTNIPPLFPSLLGSTAGKIVLFTSAVAVTTAASIAVIPVLKSTQTLAHPSADSGQAAPLFTPTQDEIDPPTSGQTITQTDTPTPTGIITPTATPPPIESTPTVASTPTPFPAPTLTLPSTEPPSISIPMAQIVSVECGSGLALYVHIRITSEAGISSYSVWSTWGGGGQIDQTFSDPLPKVIDQVIVHEHASLDNVDRLHQVGLRVTTPDSAQPIYTYALEPDGRCPGHYQPPPPPSGLSATGVSLQADPIDYVGACPVRITFSGRISVDGSGTVSYKFLRSDGASAPTQTITFDGPGSQDISTTWDLGGTGFTYSGWESIQIIDPQALTSNQAAFSIQCQ